MSLKSNSFESYAENLREFTDKFRTLKAEFERLILEDWQKIIGTFVMHTF